MIAKTKISDKRLNRLLETADLIQEKTALEDGSLGFMAQALVQATMPHSDPGDVRAWGRENGNYSLSIEPGYIFKDREPISVGLPYGIIPRLLLFWVTTEAVRTSSRTLLLGSSLSSFMRKVGLDPYTGGGQRGDAYRLREQMRRLFSARISLTYSLKESTFSRKHFSVADEINLWWNPTVTNIDSLFDSTITLAESFYDEIINRPVPVDLRALCELKQSPLALDLYAWLTYRVSYLKKDQTITWMQIHNQFGSNYQNIRAFRFKVRHILQRIKIIYPELKLSDSDIGIVLSPSHTHVPRVK